MTSRNQGTMVRGNHPDLDELAAYGSGILGAARSAIVAEHVRSCERCATSLAQVGSGGKLGLSLEVQAPSQLQHTNPSMPVATFDPTIPLALANHPTYRIIDVLGHGGMGVVYKAEHRMMGRIVALKVLAPHLTVDSEAVERFLKEVAAAGKLSHPNIVIAHDAGEAGGQQFLVMEYVEGISLNQFVARKGPLAVALACHFTRQAALGLQHAFEKGMVHRDIKPPNLMVTRKGQVKILDFGLARFARDAEAGDPSTQKLLGPAGPFTPRPNLTLPNIVMGTPDYLSPEQGRNSSAVDIRSDLYSLGCTLYFLLTGRAPFEQATTFTEKMIAHSEDEAAPVADLRSDVPEGLIAVLAKLMAKKPEDRYSTPAEAAAALAPFAKGLDAPRPSGGASPASAAGFEVLDDPSESQPEERTEVEPLPSVPKRKKGKKERSSFFERRSKVIAAVAVAILIGLCLGGIARIIGKRRAMASATPAAEKAPESGQATGAGASGGMASTRIGLPRKVLFVLPARGLEMDNYLVVRRRLEKAGVQVFTAAGPSGYSMSLGDRGNVKADYSLRPAMDLSPFSALIFVGRNSDEFTRPQTPGARVAATVIDRMRRQNGVLAAICEGEYVLEAHGALAGKSAAARPGARNRGGPGESIHWVDRGYVVDGKVMTAISPEALPSFADALVKLLAE